jgi:glycosyltransferase involved in cell wall biosynthesis
MTLIMIAPKGLSVGVIQSQIVKKGEALSEYREVKIAIHSSQLNEIDSSEKLLFIEYKKLSDLKSILKDGNLVYFRDFRTYFNLLRYRINPGYNFRTFYSFRALIHEESFYMHKSILKKCILYLIEFFVYLTSDYIGCVSLSMKKAILKKFYIKRIITIHPCCINELHEKNEIVPADIIEFVYVGGMSKWQKYDQILGAYDTLSIELKVQTTLTVITKELDLAKEIAKRKSVNFEKIQFLSLSQKDVMRKLTSFHFGFLLREDNIINSTASPVKFLEYLSCGVIPILSKFIGDYSELVTNHDIGILTNENYRVSEERISQLLQDVSIYQRMRNVAQKFTWKNLFEGNPTDPLLIN